MFSSKKVVIKSCQKFLTHRFWRAKFKWELSNFFISWTLHIYSDKIKDASKLWFIYIYTKRKKESIVFVWLTGIIIWNRKVVSRLVTLSWWMGSDNHCLVTHSLLWITKQRLHCNFHISGQNLRKIESVFFYLLRFYLSKTKC